MKVKRIDLFERDDLLEYVSVLHELEEIYSVGSLACSDEILAIVIESQLVNIFNFSFEGLQILIAEFVLEASVSVGLGHDELGQEDFKLPNNLSEEGIIFLNGFVVSQNHLQLVFVVEAAAHAFGKLLELYKLDGLRGVEVLKELVCVEGFELTELGIVLFREHIDKGEQLTLEAGLNTAQRG